MRGAMMYECKRNWLLAGSLPLALVLLPLPAMAEEDAAIEEGERRDAITVTGVRQAYRGNFAVSEIPQAIAEISAETLEQNGIQRLTDALDLNASVVRQNTLGGLWDSFAIRGFAGDENMPSGYLVNGFNGGRGFGGQRDTAGIERVDVLKGPAAALIGRGEPGGTINLVTKQAQLGRSFGSAAVQYGSWNRVRGEADVNLALSRGLTVRLIGYAEDGDTFRDQVHQSRWGFLPSVGLALGPDTRLTYDLEKTRVAVPFDRGIVVLDGNFDTVPRSRFLGEPGDGDTVARATGHQLRLDHAFNARWSLLVGGSLRDTLLTGFSSDAETVASRQSLYVDGRSLSRQRRSRRYDASHKVLRAELAGAFDTGALRHRMLIGADYDAFTYDQVFTRYRPPTLASNPSAQQGNVIDILDPVYGRFSLPQTSVMTDRVDRQHAVGAYVQDQIEIGERLQVRFGGRYDRLTLETDNRLSGVDSRRVRSRFSPQAGVVYKLDRAISLYAAYGQGFRANVGTDVNGAIFAPETSESIEGGAKLTMLGGALTGTLSVFQLTKSNVLATDPNAPGYSLAIGKARSRGQSSISTVGFRAHRPSDKLRLCRCAGAFEHARSQLFLPDPARRSARQYSPAQPQYSGRQDDRDRFARGAGGRGDAISGQAFGRDGQRLHAARAHPVPPVRQSGPDGASRTLRVRHQPVRHALVCQQLLAALGAAGCSAHRHHRFACPVLRFRCETVSC